MIRRNIHRIWKVVICGSLLFLLVYAPIETWYSWDHLASPGYICDFIAFMLLAYGCYEAIRRRPEVSVAPLCAAWGFCAALFWRSYFMRVFSRQRNLDIYVDEPWWVEPALILMLVIAFLFVGVCLYLDRAISTIECRIETQHTIGYLLRRLSGSHFWRN